MTQGWKELDTCPGFRHNDFAPHPRFPSRLHQPDHVAGVQVICRNDVKNGGVRKMYSCTVSDDKWASVGLTAWRLARELRHDGETSACYDNTVKITEEVGHLQVRKHDRAHLFWTCACIMLFFTTRKLGGICFSRFYKLTSRGRFNYALKT